MDEMALLSGLTRQNLLRQGLRALAGTMGLDTKDPTYKNPPIKPVKGRKQAFSPVVDEIAELEQQAKRAAFERALAKARPPREPHDEAGTPGFQDEGAEAE